VDCVDGFPTTLLVETVQFFFSKEIIGGPFHHKIKGYNIES